MPPIELVSSTSTACGLNPAVNPDELAERWAALQARGPVHAREIRRRLLLILVAGAVTVAGAIPRSLLPS
jgi:hypothetical protein